MIRTRPPFSDYRVGNLDFWKLTPEAREDTIFGPLRATAPVSWHPPAEGTMATPEVEGKGFGSAVGDADGFWAVTGYEEIVAISKDPVTFCNRYGMMYDDYPPEAYELMASLMAMDAPRHNKIRALVSAAFRPRRLQTIADQIRRQAATIVTNLSQVESGNCDFVKNVSEILPLWTISEMSGIPPVHRDALIENVLTLTGFMDPERNQGRNPAEVQFEAMTYLLELSRELSEERRAHPADDLISHLVEAEIDGEKLTQTEISSFFVLLCNAANETSRNTTSIGMHALSTHPEQRALLTSDLDRYLPGAIEEIVRWTSAVLTMRRTATCDVTVAGMDIKEGDKVILLYPSANFDDKIFNAPKEFDITRDPNPHIGFGGGGPHYCLGTSLARLQLTSIFTELLTRLPDIQVGHPQYEINTLIRSVKRMPCTFTPVTTGDGA